MIITCYYFMVILHYQEVPNEYNLNICSSRPRINLTRAAYFMN